MPPCFPSPWVYSQLLEGKINCKLFPVRKGLTLVYQFLQEPYN